MHILPGCRESACGPPALWFLAPLKAAPNVEMAYLEPANPVRADQLEDYDALILLAHRFDATSVPKNGRLAVVARFGVGYDSKIIGFLIEFIFLNNSLKVK